MYSHNRFTIGDVLKLRADIAFNFYVIGIIPSPPGEKKEYFYRLIAQSPDPKNSRFVFHERDLKFLRKSNLDELHGIKHIVDELNDERAKEEISILIRSTS